MQMWSKKARRGCLFFERYGETELFFLLQGGAVLFNFLQKVYNKQQKAF